HQGHTRVVAPVVTWKIDDNTSLTVDYQWFERREKAQVFFMPQIQVPLNNRNLYPAANGGQRFPYAYFGPQIDLGDDRFSVSDPNDFRDTDFNTLYVELHRKFSDHWSARAVFTYDRSYIETRQHGRGDVDMIIPAADLANLSSDPAIYLREMIDLATLERYGASTTLTRRITYQQVKSWNRYSQLEVTGRYDFDAFTWKPLFGYTYNNFDNANFTNTLNTTLSWKLLDPSTWVESNIPNSAIPAGPRAKGGGYNHGVYTVQPFSLLDDRLQVVAGARWSKGFAEATSNAPSFEITRTTPQVGVGYKLRPDLMVYANYSESFQANNRLLRLHSNVATIPAQPFLGEGYEVGLKSDLFDGRISATLAAFSIEQKNSIIVIAEIQPDGTTFGSDLQQGNAIKNEGVELEVVYSPTDNWQVYFAASYNDPRFASVGAGSEYLADTQPEYTAKEIVNLWTRYSFSGGALDGFWVGGGFYYTGSKALSANNPYLFFDDRIVFDAVVGYDWKWRGHDFTSSLSWKNLTDENDSPSSRTRGLPERLIFSVTARF
ncbi:MAG TPA: TonB-dependent receptor, partial [Opitutaceae bacterium]